MKSNRNQKAEFGFTLVEMAVVILIMGLVVGSIFSFLDVEQDQKKIDITRNNQKKIAVALSVYAQNNGKLPCPADHYLTEDNLTGNARTSCTGAELKGIVPFRTLSLTRDDIVDGYNNPITYAVVRKATVESDTDDVHQNCRIQDVWVDGSYNINPYKANFCCREMSNTDQVLRVYFKTPTTTANQVVETQNGSLSNMADPNTVYSGAVSPENLKYFAYALISHGKDGFGSFILPADDRRYQNPRPREFSGKDEENDNSITSSDMHYIDMRLQRGGQASGEYYDDIVLWRTQEQVISELGNDSCARP